MSLRGQIALDAWVGAEKAQVIFPHTGPKQNPRTRPYMVWVQNHQLGTLVICLLTPFRRSFHQGLFLGAEGLDMV